MHTLFELKTKINVDMNVFEKMKIRAEKELSKAKAGEYTQAVVLLSKNGNEYSVLIENALSCEKIDELDMLEKIIKARDTEINYALCLWQDKCIDIPSYSFRKSLCFLDPKNTETVLFVMTASGVSGIKLSTTIKEVTPTNF